MTILYKPVLIETEEQAEALPGGTVATYGEGNMKLTAHRVASLAMKPDAWNVMDDLLSSSDMVGWTALVPVEAKEETTHEMRTCRGVENFAPSYGIFQTPSRRLVTEWEDAS